MKFTGEIQELHLAIEGVRKTITLPEETVEVKHLAEDAPYELRVIRGGDKSALNIKQSYFLLGIGIAVLAGTGGGILNVGFIYSDPIVGVAVQDGVSLSSASLLGWIVVLIGGIIPQLMYTAYLMLKNKTYKDYSQAGLKDYGKLALTALIWFCALAFYAKATVILGDF
ncbi:MAG: hypothetical protein RSD02_07525 [Niameybacter sp.]